MPGEYVSPLFDYRDRMGCACDRSWSAMIVLLPFLCPMNSTDGQKTSTCPGFCRGSLLSRFHTLIVMNESKRVISDDNEQRKWPSTHHLRSKLEKQIHLRIKMDCIHKNEYKSHKKVLNKKSTWRGLLDNEDRLPSDWTSKPGVLVVI
jgi:hypothetical protein